VTHRVTLDITKLASYITQARHCLDKAEAIIQKALLDKEVERVEGKIDTGDPGSWPI
jgi:hypothetical protein